MAYFEMGYFFRTLYKGIGNYKNSRLNNAKKTKFVGNPAASRYNSCFVYLLLDLVV